MRFHRGANILFQSLVGLLEGIVHIDRDNALVVTVQISSGMSSSDRNAVVVIRNLPKSIGEARGLRRTRTVFLVPLEQSIVCFFHLLDGFENTVLLLEVLSSLPSIGETLTHHCARLHPVAMLKRSSA